MLELMTPVTLNICCFRFIKQGFPDNRLNDINKEIVMYLQEQGIAAVSSTILRERYTIRAAIVNHRTRKADIKELITQTVRGGEKVVNRAGYFSDTYPQI